MTPVQVNWLSILLAPLALVAFVIALSAKRSASKKGESVPGWGNVAQGVALALAMFVAFINMVGGAL